MSPYTPPGQTRDRVYAYVRERLLAGRPPTLRDIRAALGFRAVETAREHVRKLVEEGRLVREPGKARGVALPATTPSSPTVWVPVLGHVQAGDLSAAIEHREGEIPVSTSSPDDLFALRVRGESMTGAGIFPDDVVIVRAQATAASGDVVVALVEDDATVKTLRLRRGRVELHPANPDFHPIVPATGACRILGKVIEVRRILDG